MKQRNMPKGNPALTEKYQLRDIVWAVKLYISRSASEGYSAVDPKSGAPRWNEQNDPEKS